MSKSGSKVTSEQTKKVRNKGRSFAEWVTFGISILVLLLIISLLSYQYFGKRNKPAVIDVQVLTQRIREEGGKFYTPIEIVNSGNETVESLKVKVEYSTNGKGNETSDFEINFLSGGEKVKVIAVFDDDPRKGIITSDVLGYLIP